MVALPDGDGPACHWRDKGGATGCCDCLLELCAPQKGACPCTVGLGHASRKHDIAWAIAPRRSGAGRKGTAHCWLADSRSQARPAAESCASNPGEAGRSAPGREEAQPPPPPCLTSSLPLRGHPTLSFGTCRAASPEQGTGLMGASCASYLGKRKRGQGESESRFAPSLALESSWL